ncbi:MAG: hypothetical protein ABF575_05705 [Liquorilactobacillus hordei]|uniref:hypothetical protein n=1 Tax=Liquorilactobacillus hordei TaxID=468911 RepID=UPI0039E76429
MVSTNGEANNAVNDLIIDKFNTLSFTSKIKNGQLSVKSTTGSDSSYTFEVAWTAFEIDEGVLDEALTIALEIKINLPDFPSWGTFAKALEKIGQIAAIAAGATVLTAIVVETLPVQL